MYKIVKRISDVIISLIMLATLFPISYIILAALIKLDSKGPVVFRQIRTGFEGRSFICYKYRSMMPNADSDICQASYDDPRITPVGRIIRKFHIDEIPQFYNVLKGEMSVIGPRPHMLRHTEEFGGMIGNYHDRHKIKPGITGLAQIKGYCGPIENESDLRGRLRLDLWYIGHMSCSLDLYILSHTASMVLKKIVQ